MKRRLSVVFMMLFIFIFLLSPIASAEMKPQYGGTITLIYSSGPQVLGNDGSGPGDFVGGFPATECMMDMDENRKMVPSLAESVDIDAKNKKTTFKLRKGIKFHDGTDFTAEVAAWNYQHRIDNGRQQFGDMIERIEVEDDYTLVLHFKGYHNQLDFSFGWVPMFSKQAYITHDKQWNNTHIVGTGPFELVEWKRDVHMIWKKFDGYWQKGLPYLDGIKVVFIPDPVTASSMLQAGEADIWVTGLQAKDQKELEAKGFVRKAYWTGLNYILTPNTRDPDGPLYNKKVREAVEYALDKPAITKAIGFGYYKPLKMMHPEGNWAYDPDWPGRPYNPEKARKLLAEAGYPKGLKLELLVFPAWGGATIAEAIKAYLGDVGIDVHIDIADPGRFFGSLWGKGWKDFVISINGVDHNSLATIHSWYGHSPRTQMVDYKQSDKIIELSEKSITLLNEADQKEISRQIALELGEEALIIPLYYNPLAYMTQKYVHTNYLETGLIRWKMASMWMEKH